MTIEDLMALLNCCDQGFDIGISRVDSPYESEAEFDILYDIGNDKVIIVTFGG